MLETIDIGDTVIYIKHNEKGYILKNLYDKEAHILLHSNGVELLYYFSFNIIHSRIVLIEKWHHSN